MKLNECDGGMCAPDTGGSTMNLQTNVNGIGNAVLPSQAAMTGQDQTSKDCIGSGDKWDALTKKPSKDKKRKYIIGLATQKGVSVLESVETIEDAVNIFKKYAERKDHNDIKIYSINQ